MVKAIILAAGEGKRLRPYTNDRPKCMVKINGKSLIDRQIEILRDKLIQDIVIIGGHKIDKLEGKGDRIKENPRYFETNMVWTLFSCEEELKGDIIISYGDIVYSRKVLDTLLTSKADIAVVIDKNWESYWRARSSDPLSDAETLKLSKNGKILEIGKRPKSYEEIQGQYIGLMKFTSKGIMHLKSVFHNAKSKGSLLNKLVEEAYMTDMVQESVEAGIEVVTVPINGNWIEIDTVKDLVSNVTLNRLKSI